MEFMLLNEKKRDKQLPDIYLTEGICRSKSFGGLSHRRASSTDVTFSSSDLNFDAFSSGTLHNGIGNVFGQTSSLSSARHFIHAFSSSKSSKIHKAPCPQRTQIVFDSISKGLRDSIHLAKNDISTSRVAFDNVSVSSVMSQGRLYELEKQMKANERLLKKLEFHLSKLEELKEQYDVEHRMRDAVRKMAYEYILSPGKGKDATLQKVKQQFKECTDRLCSLEMSLESLMGTLQFEMKGIQGFARICSGDVFEVVVKHGDQKWKSRGRVMKNGEQLWENKYMLFKSLFRESLCIKAVEVRGLGKNILLGNKFCEIHDLFCAHPQQMTINLNSSGSLKLNLIITWNPLRSSTEGIIASTMSSSSFGRNSISQSSIQEAESFSEFGLGKESFLQNVDFCDNTVQSFSSESTSASASAQSSAIASPDVEVMTRACSTADDLGNLDSNLAAVSCVLRPRDANCNDPCSWSSTASDQDNSRMSNYIQPSSIPTAQKNKLTEVLKNLILIMEDIIESYPEANEISNVLGEIEHFLKSKSGVGSGSNISISVESALGCFDFLNSAIENEDFENSDKVSDDLINSTDQKMDIQVDVNDDQKVSSKSDTSSLLLSTGNEEIDIILTDHLLYCTKLISALVTSSPVKHLEKYTLFKLKQQQSCLSSLLNILHENTHYDINDFFEEKEDALRDLWNKIAGFKLFCVASNMSSELQKIIRSTAVLDSFMAAIVSPRLISCMMDADTYNPSARISVLQFKLFFSSHNDPDDVICEFAADTLAAEDLKCRDVQKASAAVDILSKIIPSSYSLFLVGCLLTEKNIELKNIAYDYLKTVGSNPQQRTKVISLYLEMLMSGNVTPRLIACAALDVLEAKHCTEQLSVIANEDKNLDVREAASSVLSRFEKLSLEESSC